MIVIINKDTESEEIYTANTIEKDMVKRTIIGYDEDNREVFSFRGVNNFDAFEISQ